MSQALAHVPSTNRFVIDPGDSLNSEISVSGDKSITVHEPCITRDHTERMLRGFGAEVGINGLTVSITGGQFLRATSLTVPGDISSAAFFLVGAAMTPGSRLLIKGVGMNPTRTGVIDILRLMGADISVENQRETGGEPLADLAVVGSELLGIQVPEEIDDKPDGAIINGRRLTGGAANSFGDHRTALAFAMASLISDGPITVLDCANVNTSFPGFASIAASAGLRISKFYA